MSLSAIEKHTIELGVGWSGNTVNTAIFRCAGLMTAGDFQYGAYYDVDKRLILFQRNMRTNQWSDVEIDRFDELLDAHCVASIGVDAAGYIHISYHHHNTPLLYKRSTRPHQIGKWTKRLEMTGCFESKVCYPAFVHSPQSGDLLFIYRHGRSSDGEVRIKRYNPKKKRWRDDELPVLSGMRQHPWTSNPYLQRPVMDGNGRLHLFTTWRTRSLGGPNIQLVNNINMDYLVSDDEGRTWQTSWGRELWRPVTQVNSETAWAVSPGTGLINQCGAAVDSKGAPITVFYANDARSIPQYQVVQLHRRQWRRKVISKRKQRFDLCGAGTLRIPISRPEIIVDAQDRPLVIFRGDISDQKLAVMRLDHATLKPSNMVLLSEDLGFSEPIIDHALWQRHQRLSALVQATDQPDQEGAPTQVEQGKTVTVSDWMIT